MELGFAGLARNLETSVEIAKRAEAAGAARIGVAESPVLFGDPYVAIQSILGATDTIKAGTFVTNPVTRHSSVQGSAFRTLDQLAPGRAFMGIGPGDSAVHSVGLSPATREELAAYVAAVRELQEADGFEVMVTVGGPKAARAAASYADALVLGQGVAPDAVEELSRGADAAERSDGEPDRWLFLVFNLAEDAAGVEEARADVRAIVMAFSRQALDVTYEGKAVDPTLHESLEALYENYTFEQHSMPGETLNARLLAGEERAELEAFLFERFALVDTPENAAERLVGIAEETGVDKIFLCHECSDPLALVRLACERMLPRLAL